MDASLCSRGHHVKKSSMPTGLNRCSCELRRKDAAIDDARIVQVHRASIDNGVESYPIRPLRFADSKFSITARNEWLHTVNEELTVAKHDARVTVPGAVVVIVTGECFPVFLRQIGRASCRESV